MRSEKQIIELILTTAKDDERIRAVVLSGSRADPGIPKDPFQDFDIVYLVTEVAPLARNMDWIKRFGELMILQTPEDMGDPPGERDGGYGYLMQFQDGNRIDLGLVPLADRDKVLAESPRKVLLDKDGIFKDAPEPPAPGWRKPPSARQFDDCCNEFWWVCPYVAKGLWRGEPVYAKRVMETFVRDQLSKMLGWHIGVMSGVTVNPGKLGRFLEKHLDPGLWDGLMKTYVGVDDESVWQALFRMTELFRQAASEVADRLGYQYHKGEDERVSAHLRHVKGLPGDAKEIYQ
jgi:aminoglycoside 6-adenylyltransferase